MNIAVPTAQNCLKGVSMKAKLILLILIVGTTGLVIAQSDFQKAVTAEQAAQLQKGPESSWCPVCGMNLNMFYKTNHALTMEDGSVHQYCSLRCLAMDLKNHPRQQHTARVVDVKTNRFIPAESAYYVVGSDIPGTMSRQSKLAFSSRWAAKSFSRKHHGQDILSFSEVLTLAGEQLQADNAMLMKKKQTMMLPKGGKLYKKLLPIDLQIPAAANIAALKSWLKTQPGVANLDEKKLQMLALYIWDTKLHPRTMTAPAVAPLQVNHEQKCPVCGMYVYKYPRWAAALDLTGSAAKPTLYFDGVKDLMKFYLDPGKWGDYPAEQTGKIRVTDYYSQQTIDGRTAWYVTGSDILGPMGHELIPFAAKEQALAFLKDHNGSNVLSFNEIDAALITALDH